MTTGANEDFQTWVGRTESVADDLSPAAALSAAALLDESEFTPVAGAGLPPLWHWFYFLPRAPQAQLGPDGHPQRGGYLPPIPYPRRMFAGARLRFLRPLVLGETAQRHAEIISVTMKSGRSGSLAFVTVRYQFDQGGQTCVQEEQDIVYREPGPPVPAPEPAELPPVPEGGWSQTMVPDTRMLFRFSALTFNAHRIHYDRPYAISEEGYPGLVVHGPLTALLLAEMVRRHCVEPMTGFSFRGVAPLFDLAPFRLVGIPSAGRVELEAQGPDGRKALTAVAETG